MERGRGSGEGEGQWRWGGAVERGRGSGEGEGFDLCKCMVCVAIDLANQLIAICIAISRAEGGFCPGP